jgi:hypothetical protein
MIEEFKERLNKRIEWSLNNTIKAQENDDEFCEQAWIGQTNALQWVSDQLKNLGEVSTETEPAQGMLGAVCAWVIQNGWTNTKTDQDGSTTYCRTYTPPSEREYLTMVEIIELYEKANCR